MIDEALTKATSDFERFAHTFFGTDDEAVREGPDEGALARLRGEERERARAMLREALGPYDARPAVGLGVLGTKDAAAPIRSLMKEHVQETSHLRAGLLVDTSVALWRIEQDPEALGHVVQVLATSPYPTTRSHAALALRQFRDPRAAQALDRAMHDDSDRLVRHHAAKSLLGLHGLAPDPRQSPPLTIRVMFDVPSIRHEAVEDIRALVREHPL